MEIGILEGNGTACTVWRYRDAKSILFRHYGYTLFNRLNKRYT